jgi:hypothetical protein
MRTGLTNVIYFIHNTTSASKTPLKPTQEKTPGKRLGANAGGGQEKTEIDGSQRV